MTGGEPMKVLDATLEWIEERIDLDHVAQVEKRHRDAMHCRQVDRLPVAIGGVPIEQFPTYLYRDTFDDPVKMMVNELVHPLYADDPCPGSSVLLKDDFPLQIRSNHGVPTVVSLFGAEYHLADEDDLNESAMPWAVPMGGRDCMASLLDKGVPELQSPLLDKVLRTMSFYKEKLAEYPRCSKAIRVTQPDLQGVMANLHLLWGMDMFIYLYEDPKFIHEMLELMVATYIAMVKKVTPYTSQQAEEGCAYMHWGVCPGSLFLRNDVPTMLSPQMYEEFVRPYDEKVFAAFPDGGSVLIGGGGDQCIDSVSKMRGLGSVHIDPQSDEELWHKALMPRKVGLEHIGYPKEAFFNGQYKERFSTGISFVTEVDGLDEGLRLKEVLDGA